MNKIIITSLILLFSSNLLANNPQTVDQIVDNHLRACGGRENLETLKSITRVGKIFFVDHAQQKPIGWINYRTDVVYPDQLREELRGEYFLFDNGKDHDVYWKFDGKNYVSIADQVEKDHLIDTARNANREMLFFQICNAQVIVPTLAGRCCQWGCF